MGGAAAAATHKKDRSLSRVKGRSPAWFTRGCALFTQHADSGNRTRGQQIIGLPLYPLSYIQVGAEGSDERRHAQRVIAAFAAAGGAGVASLDGQMIDRPHLLQARRVLALGSASAEGE